jgi:hypothetical protein
MSFFCEAVVPGCRQAACFNSLLFAPVTFRSIITQDEEQGIAGLEDFGFAVQKKSDEDDDDANADNLDEDDLDNVVDEVSDGEGDEEAGDLARQRLQRAEEKERHKEIMRRMREGYDGRRGGIVASGAGGARGTLRFDQLVAADNKDDAKR